MKHLFYPEHDELHLDWSQDGLKLEILSQHGDLYIVELNHEIVDWLIRFVLASQGWHFEQPSDDNGTPQPLSDQEDLPF